MTKQNIALAFKTILALSLSVIMLLSFLSFELAHAQNVDLNVTNIEVTQAIQTPTNTIQLVAQRSTNVRATIGVTGASGPVSDVTGRLHIFINGTEITPAEGVSPINAPFTAPLSPLRANENDTLNFELLAPSGITASNDVDFRVDITPVPGETNTANNSGSANDLTSVNRTTPSLFFTRVDYTPSGLGLPALADVQAGVGDAFIRGIYPVNDGDPNLYRQGLFPTLPFSLDPDEDNRLDGNTEERDKLLSFLASCRQLIVNNGLGAADNTFLYAWIAGNPIDSNGWGQVGGRNAFGNTELIRSQRTYAHELGHNFGLDHNNRTLDQVGWDVGARLPNNPAANNTSDRIKPMTLNDIMVGGQLTNSAWVDTTTYSFFLNSNILSASPDTGSPDQEVLVIQGAFDRAGQTLVFLEPVFRFPWLSQPFQQPPIGVGPPPEPPIIIESPIISLGVVEGRQAQSLPFAVQVTDVTGGVTTTPFNALLGDDSEEPLQFGFFEVMVALENPNLEVASLRITSADGAFVFGELNRSQPPVITIVAPQAGAALGEQTEVIWEVSDPDTLDDELQYQLAYSPDGGQTFVPIAVDVPGSQRSIVFNSTEIQQSLGDQGLIRVFVSDGLNTAFADVSNLTTTAAQFPPPFPEPIDDIPEPCRVNSRTQDQYRAGYQFGGLAVDQAWNTINQDCNQVGQFIEDVGRIFRNLSLPSNPSIDFTCRHAGLFNGGINQLEGLWPLCEELCMTDGQQVGALVGQLYCDLSIALGGLDLAATTYCRPPTSWCSEVAQSACEQEYTSFTPAYTNVLGDACKLFTEGMFTQPPPEFPPSSPLIGGVWGQFGFNGCTETPSP